MDLNKTNYIPFMDGVKAIFLDKMAEGKASPKRGWDGRKMLAEIVEEQQLTPAETDIAWGILTVDILGYDDKRIKELEDGWQKQRQEGIDKGDTYESIKNVQGSSDPLLKSIGMDSL